MAIRTITQNEEDGAIQLGNATGIVPGARETVYARGTIGDGTYGTTSGDLDYYNVFANAGDVITAEIYSRNFGETLDPIALIYDGSGASVASNDDHDGVDSLVRYTVAATGFYTVLVTGLTISQSDLFNPASGNLAGSTNTLYIGDYDIYINVNDVDHNALANSIGNNITANATDSLINGRDGNDVITGGAGDDVLDGGAGNDSVSGGGGSNTLIWTWDNLAQSDTYTIAQPGDTVEIHGGAGGDIVLTSTLNFTMGNNSFNLAGGVFNTTTFRLFGEVGDDLIDARNGNSLVGIYELFGGDGDDTLYGRDSAIRSDLLNGGNGDDLLIAGAGDDILHGGAGNDSVHGDGGNDTFRGDLDAGNDLLFGGDGTDTLSFEALTSSVTVNLLTGQAIGADTGVDTLYNIENVMGGLDGDVFTPGNGVNVINGNDGLDTLDFSGYAGYLALNMDTNVHSGTLVVGDTFSNIQNIIGGTGDDYFAGDGNNNRYEGGDGADTNGR